MIEISCRGASRSSGIGRRVRTDPIHVSERWEERKGKRYKLREIEKGMQKSGA